MRYIKEENDEEKKNEINENAEENIEENAEETIEEVKEVEKKEETSTRKVIGVRFRKTAKMEYFKIDKEELKIGDSVVVETEKGQELGRIVQILNDAENIENLEMDKILRIATQEDLKQYEENKKEANEIKEQAQKFANKLDLKMKFLLAEYTLDKTKIMLYFTSEDRVDFRELVKMLANEYRSRIELRQIGPRDEIKIYPNLGMCGREVCCRTNLEEFESVTIKDAKEQGLQINMGKISGACGKLMCCLKYEADTYRENLKDLPKYGDKVLIKETGEKGVVANIDILKKNVRVKFFKDDEIEKFENFDYTEIEIINKEG